MVQLNIRVTTQIWKRQCDKACWNQCWALRVQARDFVPDLVKVMHMSSQSSAKSWDTHSDPCVPNPKQQSQKQLNFLVEISLLTNPRRLWIWSVPGIVLRAEEGRDLSISFGWIKRNERFMWLQLFRVWEGVVLHQMTIHAFSTLDGQPFSNNILIHSSFDDYMNRMCFCHVLNRSTLFEYLDSVKCSRMAAWICTLPHIRHSIW